MIEDFAAPGGRREASVERLMERHGGSVRSSKIKIKLGGNVTASAITIQPKTYDSTHFPLDSAHT